LEELLVALLLASEPCCGSVLFAASFASGCSSGPSSSVRMPGDRRAFTAYAYARAQRCKTLQQIDVSFEPRPRDPDEQ
jgi:hypothetical protein